MDEAYPSWLPGGGVVVTVGKALASPPRLSRHYRRTPTRLPLSEATSLKGTAMSKRGQDLID